MNTIKLDQQDTKVKEYDLGLDIRHTAITAELVEKIHSIGQEINCWTVDTLEDAARVIACGVDYITTNILESLDRRVTINKLNSQITQEVKSYGKREKSGTNYRYGG